NALELQQLAQVLQKSGRTHSLREVVELARNLPPNDRPTRTYLAVARYMEKAGVFTERDQVLRLAQEFDRDGKPVVDAVLSGRTTLQALHEKQESKAKALARTEVNVQDAAARESPISE
ncbi:MAG TPA: hypothetical protein VKP30_25815, partial [Polyangiaceae bacterium]|nr:hypothetical protein [Polyangiaceae bacterium]